MLCLDKNPDVFAEAAAQHAHAACSLLLDECVALFACFPLCWVVAELLPFQGLIARVVFYSSTCTENHHGMLSALPRAMCQEMPIGTGWNLCVAI